MAGKTTSVYLASPLFTQVERQFNRQLAESVSTTMPGIRIILPQDFRISGKYNEGKNFAALYKRCLLNLEKSRVVLAVLDGADVDSGVSFEVGYAVARNIPVVGIRTDYRSGQEKGLNLMLSRACTELVREYSFGENLEQLSGSVIRRLQRLLKN